VQQAAPFLFQRLSSRYGRAHDAEDAAEIAAVLGFVAGIISEGMKRFGYSREQILELFVSFMNDGEQWARENLIGLNDVRQHQRS